MRCVPFRPLTVTAVGVPGNDRDVERVDAYTLAIFDWIARCVRREVCGSVREEREARAVKLWVAVHEHLVGGRGEGQAAIF